jgi:hypothetical protein
MADLLGGLLTRLACSLHHVKKTSEAPREIDRAVIGGLLAPWTWLA